MTAVALTALLAFLAGVGGGVAVMVGFAGLRAAWRRWWA